MISLGSQAPESRDLVEARSLKSSVVQAFSFNLTSCQRSKMLALFSTTDKINHQSIFIYTKVFNAQFRCSMPRFDQGCTFIPLESRHDRETKDCEPKIVTTR